MGAKQYELIFDGGSIGNPGSAYGSYRWKAKGGRAVSPERLAFGRGTNNQAEYKALIAGLQRLLGELDHRGVQTADVILEVRGDSRLVIMQLSGEWKVKNAVLKVLHGEASQLLSIFGEVKLVHQTRARTVRALGH